MSKILVYDGDCSMCAWLSRRSVDLGLVSEEGRRPYQSFEGELALRMEEAGIRNEMLVLEPATGELRAGIDAFLWLVADSRWRPLGRLAALAPVRALLGIAYRTIAYNRRVLAPPPRGITCACDPDPHAGFRAFFVFVLLAFITAAAWLFGHAASRVAGGIGALPLAVLAVLVGLVLLFVFRVRLPPDPFLLLGNILMVFAAGALVAVPGLALSLLFEGWVARALVGLSLLVGVGRCLATARRRLRR